MKVDTLVLSDGTLEKITDQDLDNYDYLYSVEHERLLSFISVGFFNVSINTALEYLKQFK